MDFKSMKRKELQGLCKRHKIPANLSNLEMANKLAELFKEKENPSILGLIEGQVEIASETESTNLDVSKKVKKVRFSPEHELIEFTKSSLKRSMRCLVSSGNSSLQVENVDSGKMNSENVGVVTGRVTRSRGLKLMEGKVNEKTKGQKGPECNDRKDNVSAVEKLDDVQLNESNVSKRGTKRAKGEGVRDKKALDSVDEKDLVQEIVENPGRLTRSRRQKLMEASVEMENKVLKAGKNVDEVALVGAEIDENRVVTRNSIRKRGVVVGEGKLGQSVKNNGKGLESDKIAGSNVVVEPQVVLRRSKRNENRVGDAAAVINVDTRQNEKVEIKGLKETEKESNEPELRRSNRGKHVIASHENQENGELKEENKRRYPTRGPVKELAVADGVSKDGKKVRQPTPATRTPIRTDLLVSTNENIGADVAVENFETGLKKNTRRSGRNASKAKRVEVVMGESDGNAFSQHKTEARKRKRKPIAIRTKPTYDFSFRIQSMKDVQCVKAVIGKVAAVPSKSYMDDSSYQDLPEIGESMHVDVQLSDGAESTSNPDLSNGKSTKNIVGDVGQDLSVADTAGRADVNLIDENAVENLGENAASRIAELNTSPEKQRSASNTRNVEKAHSLLQLIDKDIMNMVNIDHEAHVGLQAEGSSSNALIGANVSGNEAVAETSSSAESLLIGDQIDFKTALEEKEDEADNLVQLSTDAVYHVGEVEGISVQENLEIFETGQANGISLPIVFDHHEVDHLEASRIIFDNNTKDASPKSGGVGIFESCERRIDYTESESALQLKEPSSGNLRRVEMDSTAEGDETFLPNAVESMLAETERSAGIIPEDRRISSGETSVMASDEQGMYNDSQAVANSTEISPKGGVEVGYSPERDEAHNDKSMPSEVAETDQDGSSKVHKSNCDEDGKLSASYLFDAGRMAQDGEIFSGEISIKVSDEQGIFHDPLLVKPATVGNCGKVRDEADKTAEGHETYVSEEIQTALAEIEEGARCDEVKDSSSLQELSPSKPESVFDTQAEKTTSPLARPNATVNTIQEQEVSISASEMETYGNAEMSLVIEGTDTDKDENDATCGKDKEDVKDAVITDAEISMDYSSSKIGNESTTALKFQETDANSVEDKEDLADVRMEDVEISRNCTISKMGVESPSELKFQDTVETENECKIAEGEDIQTKFAETEEGARCDEVKGSSSLQEISPSKPESVFDTQAEKPISPLAQPNATANTIQGQVASINASEMETNGKAEISLVTEGPDTDKDEDDATCGKYKEDFKDVCIADAGISVDYSISKLRSESHAELKFEDTDTNCVEDKEDLADIRMADVEISRNCTISKMGVESFSDLKFQDTVEIENQCKNLLKGRTESDVGEEPNGLDSSQSWTEFELNNLFGSTVDGVTPARLNDTSHQGTDIENSIITGGSCSVEKIVMDEVKGSECDWEEDQLKLPFATPIKIGAISSPECVGTIEENAVTETKSDEKVPEAGHEPDGVTNEELNEVENFELVDVSTTVISEASLEQLNDDTCECLRETNLTPKANKEEKINSPGKSTVYPEALDIVTDAVEKNTISSSGSVKNLEEPEGCRNMLVDTDLQEDISCGSRVYLKSEGEIAQSSEGAFELSDVDFEKSNVLENNHQLTACCENGNILREASMCTYGSPLNEEVANTGTFDGQKDEIDEEKRSFCGAETDILSSSAMCLLFGDSEDIDIEKSKGKTPVFDLEGDHEKSDEKVPEAGHEPDGDTNEELNEVENLELVNVSTTVISEASLEQLNDDTCKCLRETDLTPEANKEEKIIPPGNSSVYDEAMEIETDSIDKHISGSSGPVKNLDELEGCRDMLIDTDLQEDICCGSRVCLKSEGEIARSSEGAFELSGIDFEKSNAPENSQDRTVSYEDGNILRETSICTYGNLLDEKVANTDRFDCQKDQIDKGTSPSHLSMSSHYDDVTCKDTCTNIQNVDNIVSAPEERSAFCGAVSDTLSSSVMRLIFGDNEDVDIEKSKVKTPVFNLEGDHEKNGEEELHLEEKVVNFNNNNHTIQDIPASGCNETLKESDVADTIKEYIDSESSLSVDLVVEGSTVDKSLVETEEWTDKKNTRTILIHGTPAKVPTMADMKENAPKHKTSNVVGDFTAIRPAKRKALEDVQWKKF